MVLFICFNGSFLKNRSKKGLFPRRKEMVLFFSSSASFVSRTAQKEGLLVSRTALLLLVSRTASCLFQEPLKEMVLFFFCLFQEPLFFSSAALLCFEELKKKGCLFQEPLAACFKNRSKKNTKLTIHNSQLTMLLVFSCEFRVFL